MIRAFLDYAAVSALVITVTAVLEWWSRREARRRP